MFIFIVLIALLLFGCVDDTTNSKGVKMVVTGFLYAKNPSSEKIKLTSMLSFSEGDSIIEVIDDAEVTISSDDISKKLITIGNGSYLFDEEVLIEANKTYTLNIEYDGITTSAQSTVPTKPKIKSLSDTMISFKDNITFSEMRDQADNLASVSVDIDVGSNFSHYIIVKCIESGKKEIIWDSLSLFMAGPDFTHISNPSFESSFKITANELRFVGKHRIIVISLNKEYVDAYNTRTQDLNTLNEPTSNIINGLGLFTSFNSDTTFFTVVKDTTNQKNVLRD